MGTGETKQGLKMLKEIEITDTILEFAKTIVNENHDILNPKVYLKHRVSDSEFEESLRDLIVKDLSIMDSYRT